MAKKELRILSESMMTINEIFNIDEAKEENHYLVIEFNDIIIKFLRYLHFWKEKKADKANINHLLKLIIQAIGSQASEQKKRNIQVILFF